MNESPCKPLQNKVITNMPCLVSQAHAQHWTARCVSQSCAAKAAHAAPSCLTQPGVRRKREKHTMTEHQKETNDLARRHISPIKVWVTENEKERITLHAG
ncbi:hypothetical protein [Bordetella trematum]|uniref:hypothetical protein n=1 Tax=Bordetella trematum TaxID=123899 RepID=UPI003AF364F7